MKSHVALTIKLMIRKYGEDMQHKRLTRTDLGDGEYESEYVVQEPKRGQVTDTMPYDEQIAKFGRYVEADFIVTFLAGTDVREGDLLLVHDEHWCEVLTFYKHQTGGTVDYFEALLRRRKGT